MFAIFKIGCIFVSAIKQITILKIKKMTTATITKTLAKVNAQPTEYSLGFRRLTVLPVRVRHNVNLACVLKGESNDNSMKEFLNNLTEQEFINWLKVA
jgi:hypothetical protein